MRVQSLFDLAGRAAIVTGGGTHLGRAMAEALAELGAAVYLASRDRARCERVAAELRADGLDATGLHCDVTIEAEVDALVSLVTADRGRLDVMVCNAGGAFTTTYLPHASIDELRQTLELNITGTYVSAQAAARAMIPRRRGRIITLGSIHGSLGADNRLYEGLDYQRSGPPYQAAKGAVVNLTRALATELAPHGITVNCLSRSDSAAGHRPGLRGALPSREPARADRHSDGSQGRGGAPCLGRRRLDHWPQPGGRRGLERLVR